MSLVNYAIGWFCQKPFTKSNWQAAFLKMALIGDEGRQDGVGAGWSCLVNSLSALTFKLTLPTTTFVFALTTRKDLSTRGVDDLFSILKHAISQR